MRKLSLLALALTLGLAVACGGGSSSPATSAAPAAPATPATGLSYTNPTGTGWRLVQDAASTPTRLLLNLVGPTGLKSRGVAFNLQAPPAVKFGTFHVDIPDTDKSTDHPIKDLGAYYLLNTTPQLGWYPYTPGIRHPLEPKLLGGGLLKDHVLTVGIFQKDRREPAKESGQALCQIALEFDSAAGLHTGDALLLSIRKAQCMAEDIGAGLDVTLEVIAKGKLQPIQIAVGSLRAN
jgi:hypothetical protein